MAKFIDLDTGLPAALNKIKTWVNSKLSAYATSSAMNTALATKQDTLTFDNTPTANSNNVVKSGGIKQAIDEKLTEVALTEISGAADIVVIDDADLAFIDQQGNIAMQVADGHIQTSEFDSAQVKAQVAANSASVASISQQIAGIGGQSDVAVKNDDNAPFDISDAAGNVVLRVTGDGNLKTKGFDSSNLDMFKSLKLGQPQCICHGYGSASGVANTLSYYRDGLAKGYKFFEVDAVNCSDGVPVCTHSAGSYEVYGKNDTTKTKVTVNFSNLTSTEVVNNYTWTAPTVEDGVITAYGEPIALLTDVIWLICFFHRYPLHVDGQGMTKASRLAASQYAESLGVGDYVFHEVTPYTDWTIPCNCIIGVTTAAQVTNYAGLYKKADNNLLFSMSTSGPNALDPTDADDAATIQAICAAAKAAGCYTEIWTIYSASTAKKWFSLGVDFIITAGVTNNQI